MARDVGSWRTVVLSIGCSVAGLALVVIAIALLNGVALVPNVQRYGQPKPWSVMPLQPSLGQAIAAAVLAFGGACLLWLAIKTFRSGRK